MPHETKTVETGLTLPNSFKGVAGRAHVLVDSHVHFHACFTWETFLEAAAANFAEVRQTLGTSNDSPGCLVLTESAGANYYRALRNETKWASAVGWQVTGTDEDCSMILSHEERGTIIIVAGRQIVTAEQLEVLAPGLTHEFPDGQPLGDVVRSVAESGAVAVVPWGFGKWWGRRGQIVRNLIYSSPRLPVFFGDNGGRPAFSRRPSLFELGEAKGIHVLPGSDPLPFPHQVERAGGYGFILNGQTPMEHPWAAIQQSLRRLSQSPPVFGRRQDLLGFAVSQCRMQWHKRQRALQP